MAIIVSCEHGGARVPAAYRALFAGAERVLASHRAVDHGALSMARALARRLEAPLFAATVTRLLVDLNRSRHHPRLFSERTAGLSAADQERLLRQHYFPYRDAVEQAVAEARGRVLHLSAHAFTPVLDGRVRRGDFGILYDPARPAELAFARALAQALRQALPWLWVRRNYPYRGVGDGLTTHLRKRWSDRRYLGIELELNQRFAGDRRARDIHEALAGSVHEAWASIRDRRSSGACRRRTEATDSHPGDTF